MPNPHYLKGTAFERRVVHDLESRGYVTMRAAGSKGAGKIDILAIRPPVQSTHMALSARVLLVQCKTSGLIAPAEWNRLREVAGWASAVPILASAVFRGPILYERIMGDKVPRSRIRLAECYDPGQRLDDRGATGLDGPDVQDQITVG